MKPCPYCGGTVTGGDERLVVVTHTQNCFWAEWMCTPYQTIMRRGFEAWDTRVVELDELRDALQGATETFHATHENVFGADLCSCEHGFCKQWLSLLARNPPCSTGGITNGRR